MVCAPRRHRPESGTGLGRERERKKKKKEREEKKEEEGRGIQPAATLGPRPTMIKAILIFNNHGKPRLSKFYQRYVRAGRGLAGRAGAGWWPGGWVVREDPWPGPAGCAGPRAAPWGKGRC